MKILQVISGLAPAFGGPINTVLGLSTALVREGQEVTIFTTDADIKGRLDVPLGIPIDIRNIKVFYFPVQYPRHYKFSLPLARALKKNIPYFDIVHIHSLFQFSTLAASYYCRKYNKPYIIRPLGQLDPFVLKRHYFYKKLYLWLFERKNLKKAQVLHFTTEEERHLTENSGIKTKSIIVGLGVDLDEFRNLPEYGTFRSKYPELKDKKIILFLSRINFKKGLDILVKAFANLARKRENVYLVIAGPDNEGYGKKVKYWLVKEGVLDRVIFTGMLLGQEKLAAFKDSDIFVLPSYSENFGMAVIEAMACGLPVIISHQVGIKRAVEEVKAGIAIKTDKEQLAKAIKYLLDNPIVCKEMGLNGKRLVQELFTWEKAAKQMIDVYEAIIKTCRS